MKRKNSMLTADNTAFHASWHPSVPDSRLSALLLLARQRLDHLQAEFEASRLSSSFTMDCVPNMGLQVDLARYEAVIMIGMSNEELGKISTGVCDTAYTALVSEAILRHKRIYIPIEGIELYQYSDSAPTAYYEYLHSRISMLSDSGIAICTMENIESCILDEHADVQKQACRPEPVLAAGSAVPAVPMAMERSLDKRVITERDILESSRGGISTLRIPVRSIVTDLAREIAASRGVVLMRV